MVFIFFTAVGVFSSANEREFVRSILGDAYINMVLENAENDNPMVVYKNMGEVNMFLGITINNIRVALMAFVFGMLLGIGTLYICIYQCRIPSCSVASSISFFYKGLLRESMRTVWIHGTIEISIIIIAVCAGLVLANGMLFSGTYTRLEPFKRGVENGLKILLSNVPFFIIAGFLEGFVSRHTEMHDLLVIFIIMYSLIFILFYYVIYPKIRYQKLGIEPNTLKK